MLCRPNIEKTLFLTLSLRPCTCTSTAARKVLAVVVVFFYQFFCVKCALLCDELAPVLAEDKTSYHLMMIWAFAPLIITSPLFIFSRRRFLLNQSVLYLFSPWMLNPFYIISAKGYVLVTLHLHETTIRDDTS